MSALNRARPRATLDARAASTSESLVSLHRRTLIASIAAALVGAPCAAQEPANADSPRVLEVLTREAQELLLEADRFEVMLIECEREPEPGEDALYRYPVEKRVEVPAREDRVKLLSRLYQGLDEETSPAMCFEPHHALRAVRGPARVELIICFQCHQMQATGLGVRTPRPGGLVAISDAARAELARLIGPLERERVVAGERLDAWWHRFATLARKGAELQLEPGDEAGVIAVAEAIGWGGGRVVHASVETLRELGPAAAPALPALQRLVEADLDRPACRGALRVLETIGPAAAPAVLGVITRLREALAVKADRVAEAAVRALGGIGPAAADAAPWLEPLAMRDDDLGRAATDALRRIRVEPR